MNWRAEFVGFIRLVAIISVVTGFLVLLLNSSATRRLRKVKKGNYSRRLEIPWETRFSEADDVIRELIATLPVEIRIEAERVPFILEKWPPAGLPQDRLGLYMSFEQAVVSQTPGPI